MSGSKGKDEEDLKWEQQCILLLRDAEMPSSQKVYDSSKLPQSSRSLHRWRCKIGSQLETQWKSISGLRLSCGRIRRFKSEARVCARFLWSAGEVEDGRINSGSAIFGGRSESHFSGSGSDLVQSVHRLCLASLPLLVWCVL
ncbi:hypothetical protein F2Q70_00031694 [Brassica cretica]|uniref:Uncharacterized protein n=1 Tax=Brassica cretica TaxID=69181 RepID=A0A8S9FIF1_BRACR|nr:hypothetical protein F2Q70_00031694 [Brassica cretica]